MAKERVMAAALQYSKWLSRFICWVWAIYRFGALIASVIEPDAATALASTLVNLDWIMIINEGTYLINSLGEKYIYSDRFVIKWLEKGGFKSMISQIGLFGSKKKDSGEDENTEDEISGDDPQADTDEEPNEEVDNG